MKSGRYYLSANVLEEDNTVKRSIVEGQRDFITRLMGANTKYTFKSSEDLKYIPDRFYQTTTDGVFPGLVPLQQGSIPIMHIPGFTEEYNIVLSNKRAAVVMDYLVKQGIDT